MILFLDGGLAERGVFLRRIFWRYALAVPIMASDQKKGNAVVGDLLHYVVSRKSLGSVRALFFALSALVWGKAISTERNPHSAHRHIVLLRLCMAQPTLPNNHR